MFIQTSRVRTFGSTTRRFEASPSSMSSVPETAEALLDRDMQVERSSQPSSVRKRLPPKVSSSFASTTTRFQPQADGAGPSPGDYEVQSSFGSRRVLISESNQRQLRSTARGIRPARTERSSRASSGCRSSRPRRASLYVVCAFPITAVFVLTVAGDRDLERIRPRRSSRSPCTWRGPACSSAR